MKFAVLGDVHGNYDAFEACIQNILLSQNIDGFIFTGDYCTDFIEGNKIIDCIRNLSERFTVYAVKGNRDDDLINIFEKHLTFNNDYDIESSKSSPLKNWNFKNTLSSFLLTFGSLTNQNVKWLRNLPDCIEIKFPNIKSILIVHNLAAKKIPSKDLSVKQILEKNKIDTVIVGHTHVPGEFVDYVQQQGEIFPTEITILNPGSVGLTETGYKGADYGILEWNQNDKDWDFSRHHVAYNYNAAIEKIKNDNIINNISKVGPALIASIESGKNVTSLYFKELKRLGNLFESTHSDSIKDYPNVEYEQVWTSGRGEDCCLDRTGPLIIKDTKQPTPFYNPTANTKMPNLAQLPPFIYNLALQHTLEHVNTFLKDSKRVPLEIESKRGGVK